VFPAEHAEAVDTSARVKPASLVVKPLHASHVGPHRSRSGGGSRGTGGVSAPYTPAQIKLAYGISQVPQNGAGQTIAIIDAYDDPTIAANLQTFDRTFGLPDPTFTKLVPSTGTPAYNAGWAMEISLDVEWAHAIAPGAKIVLIEAANASMSALLSAVDFAVSRGASEVSMSWGGGEFAGEATLDSHFNHPGVAFTASAGDSGAGVSYPSASPYVTAVGGTTLSISSTGGRLSETAWSGSGGGSSAGEATPGYQAGFAPGATRGVPDVSYNADPSTGVYVYDSAPGWGGWYEVGGTSAGAPQWAGLFALVNQGRASAGKTALGTGQTFGVNSALYKLAGGSSYTNASGGFFDVTAGSNGLSATAGYDLVTGLGSPVANKLIPALINA
jgi:subtilase family serine protease